jgi:hypothetical protein
LPGSASLRQALLGATMVTDEIDVAEQRSASLSSGSELPEAEMP